MVKYQTIIVDSKLIKNFGEIISRLDEKGVLWVISQDQSKSGIITPNTFMLIQELEKSGLMLKNVILWINRFEDITNMITNLYKNLLFLVKSNNYYLNKDPIREKHIWKDIEWGKRKRNYNPLGKDPGNVWIKTIDDNKGKIIAFEPLDFTEVIRRCILCASRDGDHILLKLRNGVNLKELNRRIDYE
jgi:hypothetical protein